MKNGCNMLYNFTKVVYDLLVHLAAPVQAEAKDDERTLGGYEQLTSTIREKEKRYIWFHAASLGEFEQGRPLIERIRAKYPDYSILLTFFSPSEL